jgi:hypothetical protein
LLHPADALALQLTTIPYEEWLAKLDDKDITPPMSPTILADPVDATSPVSFFSTLSPRDAVRPTATSRKTRGKQSDKIAAKEAFLTARGPLGPPKFKIGDIVSHVTKSVTGRILGGGDYMVNLGHADRVYDVHWDGDLEPSTEEEERMYIYRPPRNREAMVTAALTLLDNIFDNILTTQQSSPVTSVAIVSQDRDLGSTLVRDGGLSDIPL